MCCVNLVEFKHIYQYFCVNSALESEESNLKSEQQTEQAGPADDEPSTSGQQVR